MEFINKKQALIFFETETLTKFINEIFKSQEKISGFNEEVLIGIFLLH